MLYEQNTVNTVLYLCKYSSVVRRDVVRKSTGITQNTNNKKTTVRKHPIIRQLTCEEFNCRLDHIEAGKYLCNKRLTVHDHKPRDGNWD